MTILEVEWFRGLEGPLPVRTLIPKQTSVLIV